MSDTFTPLSGLDGTPGQRLRRARSSRGLTLRELARRLEVSPATLSAAENDRRGMPPERLARVAELLQTPLSHLAPTPREQVYPVAASGGGVAAGWRDFAPLELDAPLRAALTAFLEFGYHGATMRDIAQRAGLSVPGVYHHYASKQDMLVALLDVTMADLHARTTAARAEGRDAVGRFSLMVECLALYHTHRRELGFVGASEMRSLVPHERTRVAGARRNEQRMVDEEVEQACREGAFRVPRPHEASRAVVTMCTALPQWFDGRGPATAEEVAAQYVDFALNLMRYDRRRRRARSSPHPTSSADLDGHDGRT